MELEDHVLIKVIAETQLQKNRLPGTTPRQRTELLHYYIEVMSEYNSLLLAIIEEDNRQAP